MTKMDVNNGVCTMDDMWTRLDETGPVLAGTASGRTAFDKLVRPAALCRGKTAENRKLEEVEGTELSGVEVGQEGISDEEGDRVDGEEEMAPPEDPKTNRPRREEKSMKQHTYRSATGADTV